ncbi:hypothetical protein H8E07_01000, partial [bacterium]|nr:hypothetical protein [bacterium]
MPRITLTSSSAALQSSLSGSEINALGLATGQSQRLRVVTPARLASTLLGSLGGGSVQSIADLNREFNFQHGTTTRYKAFYNRLAHEGFPAFTKALVARLLGGLAQRTLTPTAGSALEEFEDIVIQDGSSFALKATLQGVFPGRFRKNDPAAVELHATFSGFLDEVTRVQLAPDKEAERQFLPDPAALRNMLLLADRGYPAVPYFCGLDDAGASFVMRLTRSWIPRVVAVHSKTGEEVLPEPVRLQEFLDENPGTLDLDVEFQKAPGRRFRLVVRP